jgi:predicted nucleic-acid-binding protein
MRIIADTNVLVRAAVQDDPAQAQVANRVLRQSDQVIVSRHALCEFVWVLGRNYKFAKPAIEMALQNLLGAKNVAVEAAPVAAGFKAMEAGADFADGVIAYEGAWLGGETFVSFDKKAVIALAKQGQKVKLLK